MQAIIAAALRTATSEERVLVREELETVRAKIEKELGRIPPALCPCAYQQMLITERKRVDDKLKEM